jgi:hypothetical protein
MNDLASLSCTHDLGDDFYYRAQLNSADDLPVEQRGQLEGCFEKVLAAMFTSRDAMHKSHRQWTKSRTPQLTCWAAALAVARRFVLRDVCGGDGYHFEVFTGEDCAKAFHDSYTLGTLPRQANGTVLTSNVDPAICIT